jgi:hypothetical protein
MTRDDLSGIGYNGFDDGWFRLPFSPVTLISSVKVGGVTVTYSQRGLKVIDIHPDTVIQTGSTGNILAVEFTAGESNNTIKNAVYRVTSDLFNYRDTYTGASMGALSFDTQRLLASLSTNTGF